MFKYVPPASTTTFKLPSNRYLLQHPTTPTELSPNLLMTASQYNSLLISHIRSHDPLSALRLFLQMHSLSVPLDSFSFPPALSAVLSLRLPSLAPQLHSLLVKSLPLSSSLLPFTSLLQLYPPLHALRLFAEIPHPDPPVYNSLISCLVDNNLITEAMSTFRAMLHSGVRFTASTLCTLLKARSLHPSQGKQIHARVCIAGCESVVLATALVDFYSRLGTVEDAVNVFNGSSGEKDAGIYNALLSGFVMNRRFEDVFLMVRRMEVNPVALSSVLNACSELCRLEYGRQIHCLMLRRGFECEAILCNVLLDMYAKCGEVKIARLVFDRIVNKNVVSWTSIIDAYGSNGLGHDALTLFRQMEKESSVLPNNITFLLVLSACNHSGLVEEGRGCLSSMKEKHGLDPSPEHYACYIDLLGRAGKIEEAWSVFLSLERMMMITAGICIVMLNACKANKDLVRGKIVASRLLALEPENPSIYVLISNFHSEVGKWKGSEELRGEVKTRGMKKEVGSCQVAV